MTSALLGGVGEDAAYIAAEVADRIARAVKKELTT
jgi:hypothetical protein